MKTTPMFILLCLALLATGCGESSAPAESAIEASKRDEPQIEVPDGPVPRQLVVNDLIAGTGKPAERGEDVVIEYRGVSYGSGEEYSSSWDRDPQSRFEMSTREMIVGWVRGLEGMRVGGRREVIVPQSLLSFDVGPPGSQAVVFVFDLLDVSPAS